MDVHEIGNRIKKARALRNFTLDDIANEIGVAKSTIQRYENGLISKPKLPVLQAIAESLEVNPTWLSGQDVPMIIDESVRGIIDTRIKELNLSLEEVAKRSGTSLSWLQNIDDYIPGYYEPYEFGYNRITKVAEAIGLPAGMLRAALAKQEIPMPDDLPHISAAEAFKDFQEADTEELHYYLNNETRQIAQEVFENPELRTLFKVARDIPPERLKAHIEFMKNLKEQETKHDDEGC